MKGRTMMSENTMQMQEKADKPATKDQKNECGGLLIYLLDEKEELRREIQFRDEEIKELKEQIKASQRDNKTQEKRIKKLEYKIEQLEKENGYLRKTIKNINEMDKQKHNLTSQKQEVEDELTKTKSEMTEMKADQVQKLNEDIDNLRKKEKAERNEVDLTEKAIICKNKEIDDLKLKKKEIEAQADTGPGTDDPQGLGTEPEKDLIIKELRRRIQELEEEVNKLKEKVKSLEKRVEYLEDDRRVVIIGELCRRLQENIYRCILPKKIPINERISYKVAKLSTFIKKNKKMSKKEKKDAEKRWAKIKTVDLKWDNGEEDWEDLMENLQDLRNDTCHEPITGEIKQEIIDAIEDLNNENFFESMNSSSEEVEKLLEMFNKTEDMLKKLAEPL